MNPADVLIAKQVTTPSSPYPRVKMVHPMRLELITSALKGPYSAQLSYGCIKNKIYKNGTPTRIRTLTISLENLSARPLHYRGIKNIIIWWRRRVSNPRTKRSICWFTFSFTFSPPGNGLRS